MDYVKLGTTGVDVSRICLGCMTYGAPGINFFDTANSYSEGTSEEFLGYRTRGVEPIEGVEAAFLELKSHSVRIAITTGFDRDVADLVLSSAGWARGVAFDALHNAGVRWNVGVLSGAHDRARLEQAPHTHVIASAASLFTAVV